MKVTTGSLGALFFAASAAAHGGVLSYGIDGTNYVGFKPYNSPTGQSTIQRVWNKYDPIQDVTLSTIACNEDGTSVPTQLTATVAAGKKVVGYWNVPWPHDTGPMLAYLGQCPSSGCTGVSPNSLQWFKIAHEGLLSGTVEKGSWAAGAMIANNNSWTVTIPSTVPQGYYLLRMETIALHSQPAQNYPECAQLFISPGGNVPPASGILVSFPGAYKQSDPGLAVDIYGQAAKTQTTYIIPGPSLYPGTGATSTTSTSTSTTTSTTTTSTSTTTTRTTTTSGTSTSTANQPLATKYAQCGGSGWTGPTQCVAGSTCTKLNDFYSQCL